MWPKEATKELVTSRFPKITEEVLELISRTVRELKCHDLDDRVIDRVWARIKPRYGGFSVDDLAEKDVRLDTPAVVGIPPTGAVFAAPVTLWIIGWR